MRIGIMNALSSHLGKYSYRCFCEAWRFRGRCRSRRTGAWKPGGVRRPKSRHEFDAFAASTPWAIDATEGISR